MTTSGSFRHGYYLASLNMVAGDYELSLQASRFYSETLGLVAKHADRFDGVSIYTRPDGSLIIRATLQNFFSDQLDVKIQDFPYPMSKEVLRICGDCGNDVKLFPASGEEFLTILKNGNRYYSFIPFHLLVPRCSYCKTMYLGYAEASELAEKMGGTLP
jgi:hypothetical protein